MIGKFAIVSLISSIGQVLGSCASQETMDLCVQLHTKSIQDNCYANNGQNYYCLCENLPSLAGCYDNCPTDLAAMGRKQGVMTEKDTYCRTANQIIPSSLPSPTINSFFAVTSQGSSLTINAGPTQVIAPIRGNEPNSNTPFAGSLYHSYTLGSLTVGYVTSSAKPMSTSLSNSTSTSASNPLPSPSMLASALILLAYLKL